MLYLTFVRVQVPRTRDAADAIWRRRFTMERVTMGHYLFVMLGMPTGNNCQLGSVLLWRFMFEYINRTLPLFPVEHVEMYIATPAGRTVERINS